MICLGDYTAEFRRGRGPDKKPRKRRRGIGAGLAVAGIGTVGLGATGATVATMEGGATRRVNRTLAQITRQPQSSLLGDINDPEYLESIRKRKLATIKRAAGNSDEAAQIYGDVMRSGQVTRTQRQSLEKIAKIQGKAARRRTLVGLARRFGNRKALIGLGAGAGVSAIAGTAYGLSRRPSPRYYDYY